MSAGLTGTACTAGSTAAVGGGEDTLAVGFTAEPQNLDFTTTDGAAIPQALLYNVYEGLVKLDANAEIVPLLAESWTVNADRTVYDFQLREGVRFGNGAPFTAEDVKFSVERVKSEWTVSLKSKMDVVDHVEVVGPTHARVVLSRPSNAWLFDMAGRVGAMFSPTGVADLANSPVGTGPYEVAQRRRGDSIVLRANPDYWGRAPEYRTVVLKYYKDPTAMSNALLSNGIDVISSITAPDAIPQFERDTRFTVLQGTTNGEVVLAYNNARPPLDDVRVRRALTLAVNREALLTTAWAGRGTLIGSMVPPTDPWYEDLSGHYPYDPGRARALLAEAGQPTPTLRLRVPNLPYAVSAAQVVASELGKVGVTVAIEPLDFPAVWLQQVFTDHDYDLSIIQHVEARDITTFGRPSYYWGYDNPRVRDLLAAADTGTRREQVAAMREVARTITEDAAANWLFLFPNVVAAKKKVTGLTPNQVSESFDLTGLGRAR
ncbi:peptide/nickel transport system substrate-binding protein [Amycolatopsis arida]|uniref:Peptide/nickel transport system substrate-binding protein n=1 Tax=Amycolatopsis arida TaxID=587909 RepID=A0A1I5TX33_9PSEU|nr:ABC transporter substrate-binding protein [Amycolatopsis arida]TDX95926.1 peptide/nickel transport system substrate-binding protein [Amycolatopsis arida]SFP87640.1 peptide/nickel transport system substrate-binding protein [Amycolatopsis arida]